MNESRKVIYWIVGSLALLFLFGCMLTTAAGLWFFARPSSNVERARPATAVRVASASQAVALTPTPITIIATPESGKDYETAVLANVYAQVNPSVVNVTVLGRGGALVPENTLPPDFDPEGLIPFSSGSGFVWDETGHIVTNNHVVEDAEEVQVTFSDGAVAIAEVVGFDLDSDLAVLRIDPEGYQLTPIRPGRMEDVFVGMRVIAIGNPFGLEGTVTSGIVSAIGRSIPARENFSIPDSIQTDAAINPGNSGGPLLNERGELIGVNAQIRSETRANSGVGFAIPVTLVDRVVPALIGDGRYEHSYMGVSGGTFSPVCAEELALPKELRGAVVSDVLPDTPASRAGLHGGEKPSSTHYPSICPAQAGGDVIVSINGEAVTAFDDLLVYLQRYTSPGDTVTVTVWREGDLFDIDMVLGARPVTVEQQ
jgi:2-alkenal reductase